MCHYTALWNIDVRKTETTWSVLWLMIHHDVVQQCELDVVVRATTVLLQIYCLVYFERIFEIAEHLAKLWGRSWLSHYKRAVYWGTVLLKDEELAWYLTNSGQELLKRITLWLILFTKSVTLWSNWCNVNHLWLVDWCHQWLNANCVRRRFVTTSFFPLGW